jgi:hypothetical protein
LIGTFGAETISVPRARTVDEVGKTTEWRLKALPRYQRLAKKAEALIASVYLAGTNTRRVVRQDRGPSGAAKACRTRCMGCFRVRSARTWSAAPGAR